MKGHQPHQQPLARQLAGERHREHGGADGHPKGIGADQGGPPRERALSCSAMVGMSPTITNSVVPMAKALKVRQKITPVA